MTIQQLLNKSLHELEAMTDDDIHKYFATFLRVVEIVEKEPVESKSATTTTRKPRTERTSKDWLAEAQALAKKHGVTVELPKELRLR